MKQKLVFIVLGLFFCLIGYSQNNFQFQHYGVEEGLSQSRIEVIFQDSRGFLWIGTPKGLNKFNGHRFEIYLPSLDTTQNRLSHQAVNDIIEDSKGNIWAGTRKGVSKFNPQTQQFTNLSKVGNCEGCLAGTITKSFFEDPPYMYVGSNAGLSRIHMDTGEVKSWWHTEETKNIPDIYSIRDIVKLDNGELMLATQDGLVFFNIEKDTFRLIGKEDGLPDNGNGIEKIFKDSEGTYWLAMASSGVVKIVGNPSQAKFQQLPLQETNGIPSITVYDIIEYPKGTLWFGSHEGIVLYSVAKNSYQYIKQRAGDDLSISSNEAKCLFLDSEKRVWLGSGYGLDVYDPYLNQFEMLTATKDKTKGLAANNTSAIFQDSKGDIWVGNVENGLTVIQKRNGLETFHHISAGAGKNQLQHPVIYGIGEDHRGRIYVSTEKGPQLIDWPDRTNYNYKVSLMPIGSISENKLPTPSIYTFKLDKDYALWLPTHGKGVIKIDANGNYTQYINENQDPKLQNSDYVIDVTVAENGIVWTTNSGTGYGTINTVERDTVVRKFKAKNPFAKLTTNNTVIYKNSIFFNTTEGSYYYKNSNELLNDGHPEYVHFTEETGLSDNTINVLLPINDSLFWASTGNGLSLINIGAKRATPYKYIAGAKNMEFLRNSGMMTKDSTIYFGGIYGVVRFKPKTLKKNEAAPKVYFSDFKILNRPVPITSEKSIETSIEKNISYLEKIVLRPSDKVISIVIDAVNFTLPMETNYAYKLEGFDEYWIYSPNPTITRSNLDPGSYTLMAKAANNDGLWSDTISLEIEILPPWWRTWWAYAAVAFLIIGIIYLLLKLRLQQERRVELARAQERDIFRKRSSRDFHDEAGTKITRIALITELAKLENLENQKLQEYLIQIDENVQDLNSGMRDFIWTLDPSNDNAYDTLTRYTEFAGKFCEYANIKFHSDDISETLKSKELNMSERRHLLMILKEATNNCVKHGNPQTIHFGVEHKPGKLILQLKDNGNGFDPNDESRGNGLKNMRERAEALGGALKIESKTNGGTTITLTLETTRLGN